MVIGYINSMEIYYHIGYVERGLGGLFRYKIFKTIEFTQQLSLLNYGTCIYKNQPTTTIWYTAGRISLRSRALHSAAGMMTINHGVKIYIYIFFFQKSKHEFLYKCWLHWFQDMRESDETTSFQVPAPLFRLIFVRSATSWGPTTYLSYPVISFDAYIVSEVL